MTADEYRKLKHKQRVQADRKANPLKYRYGYLRYEGKWRGKPFTMSFDEFVKLIEHESQPGNAGKSYRRES